MIRFLLTESLLLAACATAAGLLLASWAVDLIRQLAPAGVPRLDEVAFDGTTFAFAAAAAAVTAILFGFGPALAVVRAPVASVIGARGVAGPRSQRGRAGLLVGEVALALILLAGAGLLVRSMLRLHAIDTGWRSDGITIFTISAPEVRYPRPADVVRLFEALDGRLEAVPGVASAGRINGLPLGPSEIVYSFRRTDRPAPPASQEPNALARIIDPDYLPAVEIAVLAGRNFEARDRLGSPPVILISRELADLHWRDEDPVGKQIALNNATRTIVGVVEGVRSSNIQAPPKPEMYLPHAQFVSRSATFVVKSGLPSSEVLAASREVVRAVDPRLPLVLPGTFAALEREALALPRFNLVLLSVFAVLALALAAVGVYGVVAFAVSQRTKEIGVRIALGAEPREVLRLVIWQGMQPALLGVALGAAGALAAGRVMARLLYGVQPGDPLTIGAVVVLLVVVVAAACGVPAHRATKIPPATALRE
jgi:putative ABC transport system permease protein